MSTSVPGAVMAREMAEQPERLAGLLARRGELVSRVREVVTGPVCGLVIAARGSSDHAAVFGRYALERATRRPVSLAAPSVVTRYHTPLDYSGYVLVGVSQSGQTPEIAELLARAQAAGAVGVAITSDAASPLARAAHAVLDLRTGTEQAVPATKTVTGSLVAFLLLAEALAGPAGLGAPLDRLPGAVAAVLADPGPAEVAAQALAGADRMLAVGRGLLYGPAGEAALKIEETTGIFATGISAPDLRHGPIAAARAGLPVLAMLADGPTLADMRELLSQLRARGITPIVAGDVPEATVPLPGGLPEALLPVPAVVRAQQIALTASRRLGLDPDAPAGLSKVTRT
jgi:glucosamine--fructose-6-phosphate aminotransferase (isomerizing)